MPTVRIETIKLTEEERASLAHQVYETMRSKVGDRVIDVYISEYTAFQRKDREPDEPSALMELIAALVLPKDQMADLTQALCDAVRSALKRPAMHVTLSYIRRDQDHLGVDGELLSDLYKRLSQ